jgi:lipopolysaccharide exporter
VAKTKSGTIGSAVRLTVAGTLLTGVFQAGVIVVMARFVGPADYGAYALCIAVMTLTTNFVAACMERGLIVAEAMDLRGVLLSTGLVQVTTAVFALAVCFGLSRLGWFRVRLDLLAILLAGGVFAAFGIAPRVLLRRRLDFRWVVGSELTGVVLGVGATAVALAYAGFGVYALVGGALAQNAITLAILLYAGRHAVTPTFSRAVLGRVIGGGLGIARFSGLEVAHSQIPNFFLSSLGVSAVGLFNRSQTIVQLPVQLLTSSMTRVMISGITAAQADRERHLRASRLLVLTTGMLIGPVNFGIAGSHVAFTEVVLGKTWAAAAAMIPSMALTSFGIMTGTVIGVISEAARHFTQKAVAQGATSLFLFTALYFGVQGGLLTASMAIAAGGLFLIAVNVFVTSRVLDLSAWRILSWVAPGVVAGLACWVYSLGIARLMHGQPAILVLLVEAAGCGVLTGAYCLIWNQEVVLAIANASLPAALNQKITALVQRIPGKASKSPA